MSNAMIGRLLGYFTAIVLSCPAVAAADDVIVLSRPAPPSVADISLSTDRSFLQTTIRIDNKSDKEKTVALTATDFVEQDGKTTAAVSWAIPAGDPLVMKDGLSHEVALPAKTGYTITLTAVIAEPGIYRAEFQVNETSTSGGKELGRQTVRVTRTAQMLDNNLTISAPTLLRNLVVPSVLRDAPLTIPVSLLNKGTRIVDLSAITVASVTTKIASENIGVDNIRPQVSPCQKTANVVAINPAAICDVTLTLHNMNAPGDYTVNLSALGGTGGTAQGAVAIKVRYSWFYPAILTLIGAGAGFTVRQWRTRDRATAVALYQLALLLQRLQHIVPGSNEDRTFISAAIARIRELREQLYRGWETDVAKAAAFPARVRAIEQWVRLDAVFRAIGPGERASVQVRRREAQTLLDGADAESSALAKAVDDYGKALQSAREHDRLRMMLEGLFADHGTSLDADRDAQADGAPTQLALAARSAFQAIEAANDSLGQLPFDIGSARAAVDKARDQVGVYAKLKAATRAADRTESVEAAPGIALISPDVPPVLPFREEDEDPTNIIRRIERADQAANVIGAVVIALLAIQVFWVNNLVWGSVTDWINALLAGGGLQIGLGATITEFRNQLKPS